MTVRVVPRSWKQLRSWDDEVERWRQRGGVVVILDDYTPSHYHHPSCDDIREEHFETKRSNAWKNGAYIGSPTVQRLPAMRRRVRTAAVGEG